MTTADDLSRLFDAERAVRPPNDGLERGLSRLLTDVAQRVAPLPIATGSLRLGLSLVSKWLLLGFVVGLAGAGAASQIWAPSATAAPSALARGTAATATRTVDQPPGIAPQPPLPETPTEAPVRPGRQGYATSPMASTEGVSTFDEELRLISHARSELERGHPPAATAWLAEHAQRFPRGVFALEREALQILVSCSRKRQLQLAQAFAAQHPSSPMVERLLRACGNHEPAARSNGDFSAIDK
jgi:hypothetical protein